MPNVLEVKAIDPAALSVKSTCAYLSLGRRVVYDLIAAKVLRAKKSGARTLIAWLKPSGAESNAPGGLTTSFSIAITPDTPLSEKNGVDPPMLSAAFETPISTIVEGCRWSLLGTPRPPLTFVAYAVGVAFVVFLAGSFSFKRMERKFADVI